MGTTTFMLEFGTTLTALVAVMGMTLVASEGEDEIGNEQQIAYVIESGDAEDHIDNGTDGGKAGEVEQRIEGGQLMAHIIENSHSNEDDSPDRGGGAEGQRGSARDGNSSGATTRHQTSGWRRRGWLIGR